MDSAFGQTRCVVLVPRQRGREEKLPLLVALHGMGETVDARTGAYGWLSSYALDVAYRRLGAPPLDERDFRSWVSAERLASINASLGKKPFRGLVVACPYVPRGLGSDIAYETYASWLAERLLPRLRAEAPVTTDVARTAIDGVSFGGLTALRVGLLRPDLFGAIGTLQAAIRSDDVDPLATEIVDCLRGRPLRIVTSLADGFRAALELLHAELTSRTVPHEFLMTEGPHGYEWNRGPGAIEMLLWHDRVSHMPHSAGSTDSIPVRPRLQ